MFFKAFTESPLRLKFPLTQTDLLPFDGDLIIYFENLIEWKTMENIFINPPPSLQEVVFPETWIIHDVKT